MVRLHWRLLASGLCTGLLLVSTAGGRAQSDARSRTLVGLFSPPPIERGVSQDTSRAPDSAETRRRQSIRPASGAIDRAGRFGTRYVPGRVVVKFKDGVSALSRASAIRNGSQAALAARPSYADFDLVQIDPADDPEAVADALSARSDVEYAQADYRIYPHMVPNDPNYSLQWNLPLLDLERAWDIQPAAGSSIIVAVIDTGVAYTSATVQFVAGAFSVDAAGDVNPPGTPGTQYPALGPQTLSFVPATDLAAAGRFVAPYDFIWGDALPVDLDGHGTHVSGTIGQLTNNRTGTAGVAFGVKLMPVKVLDTEWDDIFGSPNFGTDSLVAQGVRYAADNGAKVLNLSLGRPAPPTAPVLEDAIKYAVSKGAFVVISAGNDFQSGNPLIEPAEIASRVAGAVSVGAVDRDKNHAFYSSTGSWVELAAPGGSFTPYGAPGGILQQTLDLSLVDTFQQPVSQYGPPRFDALAYYYFIGTSQAAPHVSGLAAMLMQQGITQPAAIEAALERYATDLGPPGRDDTFGYGLVEARNTLFGLGLAR